jgi:hypothetical protein
MRGLLLNSDLVSGLAGAVVLAAVALLVGGWLGLLLGLGAGLLTYLGVRLLLPSRESAAADEVAAARRDRQAALAEGQAIVRHLRGLAPRVPKPEVRGQIGRVCELADRILLVIQQDAKEPRVARDFVARYLQPTRVVLDEYVTLAVRDVASSRPQRAAVETHDLPMVETALGELYEKLHRGDVVELAAASEVLAFQLDRTPPAPGPRKEHP